MKRGKYFYRNRFGVSTTTRPSADRLPYELRSLRLCVKALRRHGVDAALIDQMDLSNEFYWYFHLNGLLEKARSTFARLNAERFGSRLSEPKIVFCTRSTGGYYHSRRNEIGISLAMTVEHGEAEFMETLLHEIGHMKHRDHSPAFYALIRSLGASGKKAPLTRLLEKKRQNFVLTRYPVEVECPQCKTRSRFKTRRVLQYACRKCCDRFAGGKFDVRFKFVTVS